MTPAVLAGSAHHHQASVLQLEAVGLFTFDSRLALEEKPSRAAERKCSNRRVFSQFRLIVRMHAHIVAAVAIVVEEDVVERGFGCFFDSRL